MTQPANKRLVTEAAQATALAAKEAVGVAAGLVTAHIAATDPHGDRAYADAGLAAKAPTASPTFTGTVAGVTKAMVGLGSVDNTTDSAKPVSTAQAAADALAAQKSANLSDLASAATARTNLGLGGAATLAVGTTTGTVAAGDDSRILGAVSVKALGPRVNLADTAVPDAHTVTDGQTTSGSATLTSATAGFTSADVGKTIVIAQIIGAGTVPVILKTTIASYTSATSVTLAANATATSTQAECVYGTNNYTAIQAAVNAAVAAHVPLYIPGAAPATAGEGYLYDGALVVAGDLDIYGDGAIGVHTPWFAGRTSPANIYADGLPDGAPYYRGSVLIQAAAATDGLTFTKAFSVNALRKFAVRFASRFVNTGHGLNWLPPITSSTYRDNGLTDSVLESVKVFGHDGNHYGFYIRNPLYNTIINCHSFGGGGITFEQNSNTCSCGNTVIIHFYLSVCAGGSAHGILQNAVDTVSILNYLTWVRAQSWIFAAAPLTALGYTPPTSAQKNLLSTSAGTGTTPAGPGTVTNISWYSPDMESNVGSTPDFTTPSGYGTAVHAGIGTNWFNSNPATATQNKTGSAVLWSATFDFCATPLADAELIVKSGSSSTPTWTAVQEVVPAGMAFVSATLSAALTTGSAITTLPVSALPVALRDKSAIAIVSGTNSQTWFLNGAAAKGATSITVYSQAPNFAYPSGSSGYGSMRRTVTCPVLASQWLQATTMVGVNVVYNQGGSVGFARS